MRGAAAKEGRGMAGAVTCEMCDCRHRRARFLGTAGDDAGNRIFGRLI